jgi:hypothetical protein
LLKVTCWKLSKNARADLSFCRTSLTDIRTKDQQFPELKIRQPKKEKLDKNYFTSTPCLRYQEQAFALWLSEA